MNRNNGKRARTMAPNMSPPRGQIDSYFLPKTIPPIMGPAALGMEASVGTNFADQTGKTAAEMDKAGAVNNRITGQ